MLAVLLEGFFEAGLDLGVGKFGEAVLGFLGNQDRVDNLVLGLSHEFRVTFAAGNLQACFRLGLDSGEGLLKEVGVDKFSIDVKHVGQVAPERQLANSKERLNLLRY